MGGDGHNLLKVPDWKSYKVETVPELVYLQKHLAARGLKDPWMRNEVWRYHPGFGTPKSNLVTFLTRGLKYGFLAFVATIAIEKAFGIDYSHDSHGHAHEQNNHGH